MNIIIITPARKLYNFKCDLAVWDGEFLKELDIVLDDADVDKILNQEIKKQKQRGSIKYLKVIDISQPSSLSKTGKPRKEKPLAPETRITLLRPKSHGAFFVDFINKKIVSINKFSNPNSLSFFDIISNLGVVPNSVTIPRMKSYIALLKDSHFVLDEKNYESSLAAKACVAIMEKAIQTKSKASPKEIQELNRLQKIYMANSYFKLNTSKWKIENYNNTSILASISSVTHTLLSHGLLFDLEMFNSIKEIVVNESQRDTAKKSQLQELKSLFESSQDKINLSNIILPSPKKPSLPNKI